MRLANKIQITNGLLLMIALFLATWAVRDETVKTLKGETENRLNRSLFHCRLLADEWLEKIAAEAKLAASGDHLKKAVSQGIETELAGAISRLEKNLGLGLSGGLVSLKARKLEHPITMPISPNSDPLDWYEPGLNGEFISVYAPGPSAISVSPIYLENSHIPEGALVFKSPLSNSFAQRMADSMGAVAVVVGQGEIVASAIADGLIIEKPKYYEIQQIIADNKIQVCKLNGMSYLAGSIEIPGADKAIAGYLILAFPLIQMEELVEKSTGRIGKILLGLLIFSYILIWFLSKQITMPVLALVDASKRLSAGELDKEVNISSGDEIGQLSGTFEQMRLELKNMIEELRDKNRKLEILNNISVEINRIEDGEKLLHLIIKTATDSVGAEKGSLMELDSATDELMLKVVYGSGEDWTEGVKGVVELRGGEGIAGMVLREQCPIMTNDPGGDSRFKHYESALLNDRISSLICLPLKLGDEPIGVINIVNKKEGHFTEEDLAFLGVFASQIGVAMHKARLFEQAITDGLTRLFVRRYFMARLDEEIIRTRRHGSTAALILLDIDHFKRVNDNYGHPAGDKVIQEVSDIIRGILRKDLDIAARYGGEEFAVLLPKTDVNGCKFVMERIRKTVSERKISIDSKVEIDITISLGAAIFPDSGNKKEEIIKEADEALYLSKNKGRNRATMAGENS